MSLKLYHYVHCPFCVRVRMALGYLDLRYESIVLPYDDESTPVKLTGKKMLPILDFDGNIINESLDIISVIDRQNKLLVKETLQNPHFKDFEVLLNKLGEPIHSLSMPYWIYTPEFSVSARAYFQKKKEEKRGPFKDLVKKREEFLNTLGPLLTEITQSLSPFYRSNLFTLHDILLASHLWGLYIVPEFQFPEAIHNYLQRVKDICRFNYHEDFWR